MVIVDIHAMVLIWGRWKDITVRYDISYIIFVLTPIRLKKFLPMHRLSEKFAFLNKWCGILSLSFSTSMICEFFLLYSIANDQF